jgi:soluble lytic murein transglycosylase
LGAAYRQWTIAYPQAFHPHVHTYATQAGIVESLVWAIMREESGFSPTVESWANAVGLMQLLIPTANRVNGKQRPEITRARLQDPAVNIRLGSAYLGFLYSGFGQTTALAIAGYNAGEGAVMKWLKQFGPIALDEFVESIPYDQTRGYTKRVLSSLFVYSALYRRGLQRIPLLRLEVPRAAQVNFERPRKAPAGRQRRKARATAARRKLAKRSKIKRNSNSRR